MRRRIIRLKYHVGDQRCTPRALLISAPHCTAQDLPGPSEGLQHKVKKCLSIYSSFSCTTVATYLLTYNTRLSYHYRYERC